MQRWGPPTAGRTIARDAGGLPKRGCQRFASSTLITSAHTRYYGEHGTDTQTVPDAGEKIGTNLVSTLAMAGLPLTSRSNTLSTTAWRRLGCFRRVRLSPILAPIYQPRDSLRVICRRSRRTNAQLRHYCASASRLPLCRPGTNEACETEGARESVLGGVGCTLQSCLSKASARLRTSELLTRVSGSFDGDHPCHWHQSRPFHHQSTRGTSIMFVGAM